MTSYLHGLHDVGGEGAFGDRPAWLVHTVALAHTRFVNYSSYATRGFRNIVRLNQGYDGLGTIPTPEHYDAFAVACAAFVEQSPGIEWVMIGNEPNHKQEWPHGQLIEPEQYAKCFNLCYKAIRRTGVPVKIMTAAVAPWNQQAGDWLWYKRTMLSNISKADGFSIHAYTHGTNPDLIFSDQKVEGWFWHFKTYQDQLKAIADVGKFPLALPAFITECDQDEAWRDANSGWVCNALAEINAWNQQSGLRKVHSVCLFRWQNVPGDKWGIESKRGVIDDFRAGVALGYTVPDVPDGPGPTPPNPEPGPEPEPTPEPLPPREIDLKLTARGVTFDFVKPTPGLEYWRITKAEWLEDAASQVGPDHHLLGQVLKDLVEQGGVKLLVNWPSGNAPITSKSDDPNASYNYDYGMSPSLNEFGIRVDDGKPSDYASGIGMGYGGNPNAHSSTWITFELVTVPETITPIPVPPPHGEIESFLVTATEGLNLREGPDTSFDVLGTLRLGSTVLSDREQDGWLHVVAGWVSSEYVADADLIPERPVLPAPPLPGALVHPLRGSIITQNFYEESDAYVQFGFRAHNGTDFGGVVAGTPILAMADGVIFRAEFDVGYGNHILIAHDQRGCYSLYAHCSELLAIIGASVGAGEPIGLLGSTGNSSGPHLHMEIREMNPDGSYREGTPMSKGRLDPRTWCFLHGLEL